MKHAAFLLPALLCFVSCASATEILTCKPFNSVIGKTVELKRAVILKEMLYDQNGEILEIYANPDGKRSDLVIRHNPENADQVLKNAGRGGSSLYLIRLNKLFYTKKYLLEDYSDPIETQNLPRVIYPKAKAFLESKVWIMKEGTQLMLERVEHSIHSEMGPSIIAYLEFVLPQFDDRIQATYYWGVGEYLKRAPWETQDILEKRYVDHSGQDFGK